MSAPCETHRGGHFPGRAQRGTVAGAGSGRCPRTAAGKNRVRSGAGPFLNIMMGDLPITPRRKVRSRRCRCDAGRYPETDDGGSGSAATGAGDFRTKGREQTRQTQAQGDRQSQVDAQKQAADQQRKPQNEIRSSTRPGETEPLSNSTPAATNNLSRRDSALADCPYVPRVASGVGWSDESQDQPRPSEGWRTVAATAVKPARNPRLVLRK